MDIRTNKVISDYITTVAAQNKGLLKAYLFGSYAKRTERPDSDIDLALIIDNLADEERFDLQVQLMLLASDFDVRIEPHPISNKDFNFNNPFVAEIIKTGIEIELLAPNSWYNYKTKAV
ncbi:MAG: nucleotidyltransferase domain-containing protein [Prolixibacteraceae bacterium]|nr:nucleotidyltransferase domain-containing protein [Prolixibacteraceae bacterium]